MAGGSDTERLPGDPDPGAVAECAWCGAVAPLPAPPGWVVAAPRPGRLHRYGVCPRCMAEQYTFPAARPGEPPGARGPRP
jgi:hypothetical protein